MAQITIIDTGYPNITSTGTVATSSNMANSGTAINLKSVTMTYNRGINIDDSSVPGKYAESEVNYGSLNNPVIVIEGIIDRKTDADMDLLIELDKCCTTKGLKCLYYDNTTDGYRDLTDSLGDDNANDGYTNHPTEPHLHIICKGLRIRHISAGTHLRYTLTCQLTS